MLHTYILLPTHFNLSVLGVSCLVLPLVYVEKQVHTADYSGVVEGSAQTGIPAQAEESCSVGQTTPQTMHKRLWYLNCLIKGMFSRAVYEKKLERKS